MKNVRAYNIFENERPVISYDFDGTLHTSVQKEHPVSVDIPEEWEPFELMINQMREDAKNHKIVIVTARDSWMSPYVWEYVKMHNLPVEEVYCTNNQSKRPTLDRIGAIKHYDDAVKLVQQLKGSSTKLVLVDPINKSFKVQESAQNLEQTKYEITFTNPQFFIAKNTVESFLRKLYDIDRELEHDPMKDGTHRNGKIVYVKSFLSLQDIREIINRFIQKYEYLRMEVVAKAK